ncbi:pseudoazurin [Arboricoccus pini]|uniref:Pseudoazurin n=1 Tax=Arboricoccus pini TaxID=1963835 RepID=A0A212QPY6_9PROT|nr:pseudoazurin [Arboricoccus pini]SNB61516.1 pseudoazurin [Arboricoccus pini]
MINIRNALFAAGIMLGVGSPLQAAEIEIKMLNKGADGGYMVFEPNFVEAAPGDTIKFVAADQGHDSVSMKGMLPEGAAEWKGRLSQEISVVVDKPGIYGYKCEPHYGMGMVGLIVVGKDTHNLEAARQVKQMGKAKKAFSELLDKAAEIKAAEAVQPSPTTLAAR